jgi:hypothetical protein
MLLDRAERGGRDGIVDPATLAPALHEPGFTEDAEVMREKRLAQLERGLKLADAVFATPESPQHGEAILVGEGVEGAEEFRLDGRQPGRGRHARNISIAIDVSTAASGSAAPITKNGPGHYARARRPP